MLSNKTLMLSLVLLLMLAAVPAMAQDAVDGGGEDAGSEEVVEEAPLPSDGEELGLGSVEKDLDLYWGGKRDVAVVQKRLFPKDGRYEFTLFSGVIPNDPFLTYIPVGGRFNYYFVESISVELAGSFTGGPLQLESELTTFLKNQRNIRANVDLLDIQLWRAGGTVVWSPFYGKLALLQRKLSHFDINLQGGFGVLQAESPPPNGIGEPEKEIKPEGIVGAGFRFFLTDNITLRMDFRQYIFKKVNGGVATPSELTLGVSFFTGG
jgi:outer membrane beta-barrel protein